MKRQIVPLMQSDVPEVESERSMALVAENAALRDALALAEGASVRRELVSQELKHRIGNLITVVQVLARKTFGAADAGRVEAFEARLCALAAAQTLLIDSETSPATLRHVVMRALAAHVTGASQITLIGPDVVLAGHRAHALTLALHELATNAAKYGALSTESGTVEICWADGDGQLSFVWRERGGPPVAKPSRTGFGTSLVTKNLSTAFAGSVDLTFDPQGVECRLHAPLVTDV